jgi:hypothetical protein
LKILFFLIISKNIKIMNMETISELSLKSVEDLDSDNEREKQI